MFNLRKHLVKLEIYIFKLKATFGGLKATPAEVSRAAATAALLRRLSLTDLGSMWDAHSI